MIKGIKKLNKKSLNFLKLFLWRCGSRGLGKPATHSVTGLRNMKYKKKATSFEATF